MNDLNTLWLAWNNGTRLEWFGQYAYNRLDFVEPWPELVAMENNLAAFYMLQGWMNRA